MTKPVNEVRKQFAQQANDALSRIESNSVEANKQSIVQYELQKTKNQLKEAEGKIEKLEEKLSQVMKRADWEEEKAKRLEGIILRYITEQKQNIKSIKDVYSKTLEIYYEMLNTDQPTWFPEVAKPNTLPAIVYAAIEYYGISIETLCGERRTPDVARPRHVITYLARKLDYSYPNIARALRMNDHSSVMYGAKKVMRRVKHGDPQTLQEVKDIQEMSEKSLEKPRTSGCV